MTVSAIICELNPLHNGHQYIMDRAKELSGKGPLICLMSGNYVQRGEPAAFSKWSRTRAALSCGADLVLELPTLYAASSAQYFAAGAIAILSSLGVVDNLYFGIEADTYREVEDYVAKRMSDENKFFEEIRKKMETGNAYCKAAAISPNPGSNNILAAEYLCALTRSGCSIKAIPIARQGNGSHHETATAIRNHLLRTGTVPAHLLPDKAAKIFQHEIETGGGPANGNFYENLLLGLLRLCSTQRLSQLPFIREGLEYKIAKEARLHGTIREITNACTSRRYPRSRIKRILLSLLTGVTADQLQRYHDTPPYIKALGWNRTGRELFRTISRQTSLPVFAQAAEGLRSLSGSAREILENEIRATDLYVLGLPALSLRIGNRELTEEIVTVTSS